MQKRTTETFVATNVSVVLFCMLCKSSTTCRIEHSLWGSGPHSGSFLYIYIDIFPPLLHQYFNLSFSLLHQYMALSFTNILLSLSLSLSLSAFLARRFSQHPPHSNSCPLFSPPLITFSNWLRQEMQRCSRFVRSESQWRYPSGHT